MILAYAAELGFIAQKTSVGVQQIDGLPLETHGMVSARFSLQYSLKRIRFFEETFLLADTSIEVDQGMPFLSLNNVDVKYAELGKLTWRSYIVAEALLITSWVEFINKKEITKAALDRNSKTFVVHIAALELLTAMLIHPSRATQVLEDPTLAAL